MNRFNVRLAVAYAKASAERLVGATRRGRPARPPIGSPREQSLPQPGDHIGSPLPAVSSPHSLRQATPVLHKPHWKWLVIGYFWTGGIAAGSLTIASIARLTGGDERIVRAGRYVALAALVPSPPLLILDLGRPKHFWRMVSHVNPRSPMSLGTWDLVLFSACCALSALRQTATEGLPAVSAARRLPDRALAAASLPPALFLGGYTGVLLGATAVPLWARLSRLLGPLFLASAMSTGAAATALMVALTSGLHRSTRRQLSRIEATSGLTELALIGFALARDGNVRTALTRRPSHRLLVAGMVIGTAAPRLFSILEHQMTTERRQALHVAGPILTLTGGFLLRTLMVLAGRASADDPAATFRLARRQ